MRRFGILVLGIGMGFAIAAFAILSLVFLVLGVGGHFLVTNDEGVARIISYDPSTVASRAPFPGAVAFVLLLVFGWMWFRFRRQDRARLSNQGRG